MAIDLNDIGRLIIDFDPAHPQPHFFATATQFAAASATDLRATPVQFPPGLSPTLNPPATPPDPSAPRLSPTRAPPATPPDPSAPLPKSDVVVVTWTVAEADTLARLLTPGVDISQWFEYTSNLAHYLPLVTGAKAPFNNRKSPRYYHSLGIYSPITLVGKKVLCIKSGL